MLAERPGRDAAGALLEQVDGRLGPVEFVDPDDVRVDDEDECS